MEGHARTWKQCRTKIKNLTQKNRKVRYTKASKHNYFVHVAPIYTSILEKIDNACCRCCQVRDSNRVSGTARTNCQDYEEINAILGNRAASSPAVLLESSISSPLTADLSSSKYTIKLELCCTSRMK